ncbi:hypothetical protein BKK49_07160 [Rodentibacter rarus]|uniref:DUF7370 family protein n=1 Tax=Rodentibacter rarus TaxID=1908260 RepID=UPI000985A0E9|nr:hypothetical protein [Rodentibacter rarus]OOF39894.1 hypothetical protein BKK49_07160 [Rodentibacter rarus]
MAAAISNSDAQSFLEEMGYSPPKSLLERFIGQVDTLDSEFDKSGYPDVTQELIKLYLVALLAVSSGARRVKSEGAPSGASRSFDFGEDVIGNLKAVVRGLDPLGITSDLLPKEKTVGFFNVVGGCDV